MDKEYILELLLTNKIRKTQFRIELLEVFMNTKLVLIKMVPPPVYQLSTLTTESFHDAPAQDGLPSPRPGPSLPLLPFNIAPHNFFPFLPPSSGLYSWMRCTSRFNAGSRIIENNLREYFFLFLPHVGTLTQWAPILTLRAYLYLT